MDVQIENFNLRVYGLLINKDAVLVTDEMRSGMHMTKFPGGGLEKGEGLESCLIREFREELNIEITVKELFYVNEFFQQSAFNRKDQLISFYYLVETAELQTINFSVSSAEAVDSQSFRWVRISDLSPEQFTFPVDKVVAERMRKQLG